MNDHQEAKKLPIRRCLMIIISHLTHPQIRWELDGAIRFLGDRVLKQKDENKSHLWLDELRRALARLNMTMHTTDEAVAPLALPWYGGRRDEFGRLESEVAKGGEERSRARPNFADPAYWESYWENFFQVEGYFTEKEQDVNTEFDSVWPQVETFMAALEEQEAKMRASKQNKQADAASVRRAAPPRDDESNAGPSHRSVLVLGCGMSSTPVQLYSKGFRQITCIDVSSRVINNLTERYKKHPGIEVLEVDARNLDRFATASFDLVVEKGLMDALFSGWRGFRDVDLVNENVCRVLKPGGCFVSICCAPPQLRSAHFLESSTASAESRFYPWDLRAAKGPDNAGDAGGLFVYIMTRLGEGESKELGEDDGGAAEKDGLLSVAEMKLVREAKTGSKTLRQRSYVKKDGGGHIDLQVVRDPMVLQADGAPRVEPRPTTPTMEEYLSDVKTPADALEVQRLRKLDLENGESSSSSNHQGGGEPIASEVGFAKKKLQLRRGHADNAALKGGDATGKGYKSEAFIAAQAEQARLRRRAFSLEPVQELARETVRQLAEKNAAGGGGGGTPVAPDVNDLINELVRGQAELARLRQERPPQALEPRGDAVPVSILDYEQKRRALEDAELRAHRAKLGLDENDLTRPPEKWTPAMLSFVEYTDYGPRPPEEEDKWKTLEDPVYLQELCTKIVNDVACEKQLQQWTDGKNKVYKFFLSRALEATEDKAPVSLLKEALNKALGAFRPVEGDDGDAARRRRRRRGLGSRGEGDQDDEAMEQVGGGGGGARRRGERGAVGGGDNIEGAQLKASSKNRMRTLREMDERLSKGHKLEDDGRW